MSMARIMGATKRVFKPRSRQTSAASRPPEATMNVPPRGDARRYCHDCLRSAQMRVVRIATPIDNKVIPDKWIAPYQAGVPTRACKTTGNTLLVTAEATITNTREISAASCSCLVPTMRSFNWNLA